MAVSAKSAEFDSVGGCEAGASRAQSVFQTRLRLRVLPQSRRRRPNKYQPRIQRDNFCLSNIITQAASTHARTLTRAHANWILITTRSAAAATARKQHAQIKSIDFAFARFLSHTNRISRCEMRSPIKPGEKLVLCNKLKFAFYLIHVIDQCAATER